MDKELFKRIIKAVESGGGENTIPTESTRYGTAGGAYQITPGEVQSLPNRLRNDNLDVPPEVAKLAADKNYNNITNELNTNPPLDEKVGDSLSDLLLKRNHGDLLKSAYRHHMGTNAAIPSSTAEMFQKTHDPEYLQKVLSSYINSSPDKNILDSEKFAEHRDDQAKELMDRQTFERLQKLLTQK